MLVIEVLQELSWWQCEKCSVTVPDLLFPELRAVPRET